MRSEQEMDEFSHRGTPPGREPHISPAAQRIVKFFVHRRSLVHTLTLLFILAGLISYHGLPQEIFPVIKTHKIEIRASYAGASADDFDQIITSRIEDEVQNLDGVKLVESITWNGSCLITVTLDQGASIVDSLFRVRDAIDRIRSDFPKDMDDPTVARKIDKNPLLTLSISGADEKTLQGVADIVKDDVESIDHISSATINGKADPEIHIFLHADRIEALGLTPARIVSAIRDFSNNSPLGEIKESGNHLYITTPGGPADLDQWNSLIIKIAGKKLHLSSIAEIREELSEPKSLSHFDAQRNISLTIFKTTDGSSTKLSRLIRSKIEQWEQEWPGLTFAVYSDLSVYVKNRLNTVKSSAVVGLILVALSLYLFLNWRVSLIVLMGMPTTFLIALVYLGYRGESINMLSLFSFLMALGIVVDDSIVVGENIHRHMERGLDRIQASIIGAAEVFWPVCTATFTTCISFLPLLMISGEIGIFLSIIPIFVSTVIIASLFEAFVILPVHAVEICRPDAARSPFSNWEPARAMYKRILLPLMNRKWITLSSSLVIVAVALAAGKILLGFNLIPPFDTDQIYIRGKLTTDHGIFDTEKVVTDIERRVMVTIPSDDLESVATHIGMSFNDKMEFDIGEDLFQIFINLKKPEPGNWLERWVYPVVTLGSYSFGTRKHSAQELVQQLEKELSDIKIQRLTITKPKAGIVRADIEISLSWPKSQQHRNIKPIHQAALILEQGLSRIDGVENIADNFDPGKLQLELRINQRGKELGFTEEYLAANLIPYYLNPKTDRIVKHVKDDLVVRTYLLGRDELASFNSLRIQVPGSGHLVYLSQVCNIVPVRGMARIWKENGMKEITVTASIDKQKTTSDQAIEEIQPLLSKIREKGINVSLKGEKKVADRTMREMLLAATVAILGIFIILLLQFNSVKDSMTILVSVPFALVGVIAGHLLMGQNLSITSMLGFVGLAGVAVNDAIIMVDFLKRHVTDKGRREIFLDAASKRLRPVILTSCTTFASLVPLIFFATGQAMILSPMAISFGYGLLAATVANLLLVPVVYAILHRIDFSQ